MVDENIVEGAVDVKFLGINLDKGLTWENQINNVCRKIASGIFGLRKLSSFCSPQILLMAYYGLIFPHLNYGIMFWGSCAHRHFNRVFILQKKAIRILGKMNYRDSCREIFKTMGIMTLASLYIFETILHCLKSKPLQGNSIHSYNTRIRYDLRVEQHRTTLFSKHPSQAGVKLFNLLPNVLKFENDFKLFKARLKRHLVSCAFYDVDEYIQYHQVI